MHGLIFDEIQTGVGRSGYLYSYQKFGVVPDILTSAKGLGGGFPIGAMLTTEEIARSLKVGTHGSTFGGNPMACAVACKLLDIVSAPELLDSVRRKSDLLRRELVSIHQTYDVFEDVRGQGLLLGCELKGKWRGQARGILTRCMENGMLILMAGADVLRIVPPLIIDEADILAGAKILAESIGEMDKN